MLHDVCNRQKVVAEKKPEKARKCALRDLLKAFTRGNVTNATLGHKENTVFHIMFI